MNCIPRLFFLYSEHQSLIKEKSVEDNVSSSPLKMVIDNPIVASADKILVRIFSLILKTKSFFSSKD